MAKTKVIYDVPLSEKYALTIDEAASYTGVPVRVLKEIGRQKDCPFTLAQSKRGRKMMIRREALERYLNENNL